MNTDSVTFRVEDADDTGVAVIKVEDAGFRTEMMSIQDGETFTVKAIGGTLKVEHDR